MFRGGFHGHLVPEYYLALLEGFLLSTSLLCAQVDYKEKASAGGQFPRNRQRRDIGITEREILISRRIGKIQYTLYMCICCSTILTSSSLFKPVKFFNRTRNPDQQMHWYNIKCTLYICKFCSTILTSG